MSGYQNVLERIGNACIKSGRNLHEIKLVVVSKKRHLQEIKNIYDFGHRFFAENIVQEAQAKIGLLPEDIEWHLIGHLQSNKAKSAVKMFSLIQSLDSVRLADEINKCAFKINKVQDCLVELKISDEETKTGADMKDLDDILLLVSSSANIRILGLMGMAPFTSDTDEIRKAFSILKKKFDELAKIKSDKIEMKWLSMGMSSDFEIAIDEGSNMLRIGTAVFTD